MRYSPHVVEGKYSEIGLPFYGDHGNSAKTSRDWLVRSSKCSAPLSDAFASCPCYGSSDSWRGGTCKSTTRKGVQDATIHSPEG
jgi:hypothetical protein